VKRWYIPVIGLEHKVAGISLVAENKQDALEAAVSAIMNVPLISEAVDKGQKVYLGVPVPFEKVFKEH